MVIVIAVLLVATLLVGLVVGLAVLARMLRKSQAQVQADTRLALESTRQVLEVERAQTVQAAVDTVLSLAGDKFADHSSAASRELDLRGAAFEKQVDGMNEELRQVRGLVTSLQRDRAEQQGRLEQGLAETARTTASLVDTTQTLREALANPKARGQWGERMAEDVLRAAGFVEGVNYRKQTGAVGGGIPDITFLLPQDRLLHMDVKFPLDNYLRSLEADTDAERATLAGRFLKDVRARVIEITGRHYIDPETTVDTVLLFLPNESVYGFIHENDPGLADLALEHKVVLCSPFTLFAVLAVIRQAVDQFVLERTSDEILRCLGGFTGQWQKFSEGLDTLGRRFDSTQKAYDDLAGTRRRQLQRSLDEIDALRSRRGLPAVEYPDVVPLGNDYGTDAETEIDDDSLADEPDSMPVPRLRPVRLG